jgi:hypothetical protein
VRRPTDRQAKRRNLSGARREICNQVPSPKARDFLIRITGRARQAAQAKATAEHAHERTPRCVSAQRRAATPAWTEMAGAL